MRLKKTILGIIAVAICTMTFETLVFSQELNWSVISAKSTGVGGVGCSPDDVHLISAGANVALIFEKMTANLAGGDKLGKRLELGHCRVQLKMTIPRGYYIPDASNLITGGVEKSKGAYGYIQSTTHLWGRAPGSSSGQPGAGLYAKLFDAQQVFRVNEAVSLPLLQLESQRRLTTSQRRKLCQATQDTDFDALVVVHLNILASRTKDQQTSIVAVDAYDANINLGLSLARCQ